MPFEQHRSALRSPGDRLEQPERSVRPVQHASLVVCLVPLGGRVGVPYDTPADAVGGPTEVGVHPGGANGDVELEIAVGWDGADRAGVEATRCPLEVGDEAGGVDLGRSGDRCAGEGGGEHVEEAGVGLHFDGGGELVDRREALDRVQRRGHQRAGVADPAEVVAHHVDDHRVLGSILLTLEKFADDVGVVDRIGVARPSALHRAAYEGTAAATDEELR